MESSLRVNKATQAFCAQVVFGSDDEWKCHFHNFGMVEMVITETSSVGEPGDKFFGD